MEELLKKISAYDLLNNFIPGVVIAGLSIHLTPYDLTLTDPLLAIVVYYFYGVVISRLGSVFIEPALKWSRFIQFAQYQDYIRASQKDSMVELLSETNNIYRGLLSTMIGLAVLNLWFLMTQQHPLILEYSTPLIISAGIILFLFSYRKQTQYVVKRVSNANQQSDS